MGQKRRRLALSCVDCRRRKVRCGREQPACVRCIKGGQADSCKYVCYDDKSGTLLTPTDDSPENVRERSDAEESWAEEAATYHRSSKQVANVETAQSLPPRHNTVVNRLPAEHRTLEELQERVFELVTYMRSAGSKPVPSQMFLGLGHPEGPGTVLKDSPQEFERSLLRGRSFKTQYYGPSNAVSLLLQFEELSTFVKVSLDPVFVVCLFDDGRDVSSASLAVASMLASSLNLVSDVLRVASAADILKRMPSFEKTKEVFKNVRSQAESAAGQQDPVVKSLESFAAMVPPKERSDLLVQEYLSIFETTYRVLHIPTFMHHYDEFWNSPEDTDVEFVVQLLLVMAAVNCVVDGGSYGFVGRSSVGRETSHRWIEATEAWLDRQSHKHTTLEYYQTHILLFIAKVMTCYKVKREWLSAQHLLSMAITAGFHREPTSLSSKISTFDQEMRRRLWFTILELNMESSCDRGMRVSVGPDDWDCHAPLNIHDEDFNQTTQTMPPSKALTEFTRTSFLCQQVRHLPLRLEILTRVNSISRTLELEAVMQFDGQIRAQLDALPSWPDKPLTKAPKALSALVLHDYLLLLHQPFATQRLAQSQYFYSRCTRRESALHIMKAYSELPELIALAYTNIRVDGFRAALATCHDIAIASGLGREDIMQDKTLAVDLITKFVDLSGRRVKSLGQGFHSYWICSSALSLASMKLASTPAEPEEYVLQAVNRMIKLHNDLMDLQQKGYDGKILSPTAEVGPLPGLPLATVLQPPIQPAFDASTIPSFDTLNTAMFDFDFDDSYTWWADNGLGVLT